MENRLRQSGLSFFLTEARPAGWGSGLNVCCVSRLVTRSPKNTTRRELKLDEMKLDTPHLEPTMLQTGKRENLHRTELVPSMDRIAFLLLHFRHFLLTIQVPKIKIRSTVCPSAPMPKLLSFRKHHPARARKEIDVFNLISKCLSRNVT